MKSKRQSCVIFLAVFLLILPNISRADITIGLFLSNQTHFIGAPASTLSITALNPDAALARDVHIGIISPSGTIYEYPDWNTNLQPWLPAFTIPGNFQLGNTVITDVGGVPGGLTPGIWRPFFALTKPGTIDITDIQLIDLNVIDPAQTTTVNNGVVGSRFGVVSLIRIQNLSVSQLIVTANGGFYGADTQFPDLFDALQGQEPVVDECVLNQTQSTPGTGLDFDLTALDAGNLTVTGQQTLAMTKNIDLPNIIYSAIPSVSFFDNASNFTFNGSGGPGIGAFNVTVPSTNSIELLNPAGPEFSIATNQDFNLNWTNNNNGAGEVRVTLSGLFLGLDDPDASVVNSISCRFIDDGLGIIPENLITQLQQSLPDNSGFEFPVDLPFDIPIDIPGLNNSLILTVTRTNMQFFTTSEPKLDIGLASVASGTSMLGNFQ